MKILPRTLTLGLAVSAIALINSQQASAQNATWDGGGGNNSWTTPENWVGDAAPGSGGTLTFAGSTQTNANNNFASDTIFNIRFDGAASPFTLSGNRIGLSTANDVSGNIRWLTTPTAPVTQTISADINFSPAGATTRTLNVAGNATLVLSGVLSGSAGFNKLGLGTLRLTNDASTIGGTRVILSTTTTEFTSIGNVGANSALGRSDFLQIGNAANTATAILVGSSSAQSSNKTIFIGSNTAASAGGAIIRNDNADAAHTLTFSAAFFNGTGPTVDNARTLTLGGSNTGANTILGEIRNHNAGTGTIALEKTDSGTWVLGGNNTYTGNTTVTGGTLILNGSTSATSTVSVASGSILGGNGTIGGTASITGSLRPGNSIGTLSAGTTTWVGAASGGTATDWVFELGAGDTSDRLNITGNFERNISLGSTFRFDFAGSTAVGTFILVDWTGSTSFSATDFSYTNLGGGNTGAFAFNGTQLELTVIPEPWTWALLLPAMAIVVALRRRRLI